MILTVKYFELKSVSLILTIIFLAGFNLTAYGAGELDSTFTASVFGNLNGSVNVVKVQPDGKILIGGHFTDVHGFAASGIARLNADGTVDTSFQSLDFYQGFFGMGYIVLAIELQPDGKILVGGGFAGADDDPRLGIRRLNANGSRDISFSFVGFNPGSGGTVTDIEIQPDGKILVGGAFNLGSSANIARYNADGTVDTSFSPLTTVAQVRDMHIQADGKILVGSSSNFRRLNANGTIDNTFQTVNVSIEAVEIRPDGKSLIVGAFTSVNSFTQGRIALINTDGTLDLTFNQNELGANGTIVDLELRADGKILIAGAFTTYNTISRTKLARLNADGSLDAAFVPTTTLTAATVNDATHLTDGSRILVGINAQTGLTALMRFDENGTFDQSLAPAIHRGGVVYKTVRQPDGKVLVAGEFPLANGVRRNSLARFNTDGSLDTSFVPYFNNLTTIQVINFLDLMPDGKIFVFSNSGIGFRRLNTDGSLDSSFSSGLSGIVYDVVQLANGQYLVGGWMNTVNGTRYIIRLTANGGHDLSFATAQPNQAVSKIVVQSDGKIFIGGSFSQIGSTLRGRIARLNEDGSLENTFNPPGGANSSIYDFEVQPDGKVVVGGGFTALNGSTNQVSIGRLNPDGTLDTGFVQTTNGAVNTIELQPDGKILIGGTMSMVQGIARNGIARLNANGAVDIGFATFANMTVHDITLQPDGKILMGGAFTKINRLSAVRVARLLNVAAPLRTLFDYEGDGRADVSVFRPSENKWFIYRSFDGQIIQQIFAVAGDVPVPADYDGDGKTDIAIFRGSSGDWWYLSSVNGAQVQTHWGANGDIPRPSDFDGDGRADFIVFRQGENNWYRLGSTGLFSAVNFGLAGDKPVTGDFNGDGKSDVAIYRPSTGDWWWRSSADNVQRATRWGISTDIPAPADYDGDGKTDFAVYRPSEGVWYIYNSSNGSFTIQRFGLAEDKPVPADYDGDGRADIAVFRPSTGIWYLLRSSAGFTAQQFGISSDVPTPNAFVP